MGLFSFLKKKPSSKDTTEQPGNKSADGQQNGQTGASMADALPNRENALPAAYSTF